MEIKNILVPIDLSEVAEEVLTEAADLATRCGAKLHFLYALNPAIFMSPGVGMAMPVTISDRVIEDALAQLETLRSRVTQVPVIIKTEIGVAPIVIEEYIQAIPIDLVVMATHGRRGVAHFLMGSTTEHVIRRAPCPVLSMHITRAPAVEANTKVAAASGS